MNSYASSSPTPSEEHSALTRDLIYRIAFSLVRTDGVVLSKNNLLRLTGLSLEEVKQRYASLSRYSSREALYSLTLPQFEALYGSTTGGIQVLETIKQMNQKFEQNIIDPNKHPTLCFKFLLSFFGTTPSDLARHIETAFLDENLRIAQSKRSLCIHQEDLYTLALQFIPQKSRRLQIDTVTTDDFGDLHIQNQTLEERLQDEIDTILDDLRAGKGVDSNKVNGKLLRHLIYDCTKGSKYSSRTTEEF